MSEGAQAQYSSRNARVHSAGQGLGSSSRRDIGCAGGALHKVGCREACGAAGGAQAHSAIGRCPTHGAVSGVPKLAVQQGACWVQHQGEGRGHMVQ